MVLENEVALGKDLYEEPCLICLELFVLPFDRDTARQECSSFEADLTKLSLQAARTHTSLVIPLAGSFLLSIREVITKVEE